MTKYLKYDSIEKDVLHSFFCEVPMFRHIKLFLMMELTLCMLEILFLHATTAAPAPLAIIFAFAMVLTARVMFVTVPKSVYQGYRERYG